VTILMSGCAGAGIHTKLWGIEEFAAEEHLLLRVAGIEYGGGVVSMNADVYDMRMHRGASGSGASVDEVPDHSQAGAED